MEDAHMEKLESHACFGGRQEVWKHHSRVLGCEMRVGVYLPPQAANARLSGAVLVVAG